jgi:phosphoribosylaminoimidazole-succinocarboxamide synthase
LKFLASGKVKDIYDLEDGNLLFLFSDRISAYDVKFNEDIPRKGEILCKFAEFWFNKLDIENHFVRTESKTGIIVKKMKMLPIECVVRGYFYGSLVNRWKNNEVSLPNNTNMELAAKMPKPFFDPTTKSTHDIPINKKSSIEMGLVTSDEFDWLSETSIKIYEEMASIADSAGFILADLKLEFGKLDDQIILGDSIGPDEYRLWPKDSYSVGKTQESYDKQLLRDWLTKNGFQKKFDEARANGKDPIAPIIPEDLISKITKRYVIAYDKFTKNSS